MIYGPREQLESEYPQMLDGARMVCGTNANQHHIQKAQHNRNRPKGTTLMEILTAKELQTKYDQLQRDYLGLEATCSAEATNRRELAEAVLEWRDSTFSSEAKAYERMISLAEGMIV